MRLKCGQLEEPVFFSNYGTVGMGEPMGFRALSGRSFIEVLANKHFRRAMKRVLAFKKLDPEIRSFQVTIHDSQEVSSASATMSSAGKSAKSAKSASKFGIDDLANVRSSRKKTPASPSTSVPKAPVRGN
ncbi:hypothetical protein Hdeb2414_s1001g00971791 [Helianthus debilis subsp. tardiflorus]